MNGSPRLFLLVCLGVGWVLAACVQATPTAIPAPTPTDTVLPTATFTPAPTDTPTVEPSSTPAPTDTPTPEPVGVDDWQEFVDLERGLSIFYPDGWIFIDPTQEDLEALFSESDEQINSEEIKGLLTALTDISQQQDIFVGLGFSFDFETLAEIPYANNVTVISLPTDGLTLNLYAQLVSAQLDGIDGIDVDSAEVVPGLRPQGAEVVSILYRADGALYGLTDLEITGWQVGVLSPDTESLLVFTFGIRADQFGAMEPLLAEIVQRIEFRQ